MCHAALRRRDVFSAVALLAILLPSPPAPAQHTTSLKRRGQTVFASLPFDPRDAAALSLSPDGTRGGYVIQRGPVFHAVIDGQQGPAYQRIGRAGVVFSPAGDHAAYAAQRDDQWLVVLDNVAGPPFDVVRDETLTFSTAGRLAHVAEREGKSLVVLDGQPGMPYTRVADGSLSFSPDGGHVAYVAADARGEFLVYDGMEGPAHAAVSPPRFSPDGAHFAYAASDANGSTLYLDGAPAETFAGGAAAVLGRSLALSPDGTRLACVIDSPEGQRVHVTGPGAADGKPYERVIEDSLAFGGDAARLAYVARQGGRAIVVVDGSEIARHDGVVSGTIRFSLDGRRVAYVAETNSKGVVRRCVVTDGVEGKPYDWITSPPVFSPDGRRVACVVERRRPAGEGFESLLTVDGAEAAPFPWARGDPVFSADARRIAYLAAGEDTRFADASVVPRAPGHPAAGGRLVIQKSPAFAAMPPGQANAPVRLMVVEEDVVTD